MTNNEFKQIRHSMNLTQLEFSKLLHVHVRTVARWESGDWKLTKGKVDLIGYIYREWLGKQEKWSIEFGNCWRTSEIQRDII